MTKLKNTTTTNSPTVKVKKKKATSVKRKISLILRKAYGGAYIAMNSKGLGADCVFAWPIAQIAVMGSEGAVDIIYRTMEKTGMIHENEAGFFFAKLFHANFFITGKSGQF